MTDGNQKESPQERARWSEALQRVRLYLSGVLGEDPWRLAETSLRVVEDARKRYAADPGREPLDHALQAAEDYLVHNLRGFAPGGQDQKRILESEIVLHFLAQAGAQDGPDASVLGKLKGRSLAVSSMTARPIDYGPLVEAETGMEKEWRPVVKVAAVWFVFYWIAFFAIRSWQVRA